MTLTRVPLVQQEQNINKEQKKTNGIYRDGSFEEFYFKGEYKNGGGGIRSRSTFNMKVVTYLYADRNNPTKKRMDQLQQQCAR